MTTQPLYESLRTIRLYGPLGARFGRVHRLAVQSTAEAIRALCVLYDGFEAYLMASKDQGIGFAVFIGKRNIVEDELHFRANNDIRIAPIIMGSKQSGLFSIVLGIALIGVSFLVPGGGLLAGALFNAGIGMALGGIVQLLSPQPKDRQSKDKPENEPNYAFNGPINTQAQGNCVPVAYGKQVWCGSAVVSAGIQVGDDIYIPETTAGSLTDFLLATGPEFYYPTMQEDITGNHATLLPTGAVTQDANGATFTGPPWGSVSENTGAFGATGFATVLIRVRVDDIADAGVLKQVFSHTTNNLLGYAYWGLYLRSGHPSGTDPTNMTPQVQFGALSPGGGATVNAAAPISVDTIYVIGFRTRLTLGVEYLDLVVDGLVVGSVAFDGAPGGSSASLISGGNTFGGNTKHGIGWARSLSDAELLQYSNYIKAGHTDEVEESGDGDDFWQHVEEAIENA